MTSPPAATSRFTTKRGFPILGVVLAASLVAVGLSFVLPNSASALEPVEGVVDEPGVTLYSAGSDGAFCDGLPASAPTNAVVVNAINANVLEFIGDTPEEVTSFTVGLPGENFGPDADGNFFDEDGNPLPDADETIEEVVQGLTTIDDFGTIAGGGDDAENFDGGTGGSVVLSLDGRIIIPDGIVATGTVGVSDDPLDALDGNEIFIFEDAELSGFILTLIGFQSRYEITIDDLQLNPATATGADDTMIAIDLDTLISNGSFNDFAVTAIEIRDDGIPQASGPSCGEQVPGFDTALELDAVATRGDTLPSIDIEKSTNGQDADVAAEPEFVGVPRVFLGDQVDWVYDITNSSNNVLVDISVTDNQLEDSAIDCGGGTNLIPRLEPGAVAQCTATGAAVAGLYSNIGAVVGAPLNAIGQPIPGATVSDTDPSHYLGVDAPTASIGDRVWEDTNENGLQDDGEVGVAGITVNVLDSAGAIAGTAETDDQGNYLVSGLAPIASYSVQFVAPGRLFTEANVGEPDNDEIDSDAAVDTGETVAVELGRGETNLTFDAGLLPVRGAIGDRVWLDLDGDGVQDDGEPGIADVTVELVGPDGTVLESVVTGPNGDYIFNDVPPGDYVVRVVPPAGVSPTYDLDGGLDNESAEQLEPNETNLDHDFGFIPPGIFSVEKSTNGVDSDDAPGNRIPVGDPVVWTYEVSNDGLVELFDVTVTDSQLDDSEIDCGNGTNVIPSLAADTSVTCEANGVSVAGPYNNVATVTGNDPLGNPLDPVEDPSNYFGGAPLLNIEKSTNGADADAAPGPSIGLGDTVTWTYVVSNDGNVDISDIIVSDSVIADELIICADSGDNTIALIVVGGPAVTCTATGPAILGQYQNMGRAVGADPDGNVVSDEDPSNYFGTASPSVNIEKSTNGDDADDVPGLGVAAGAPVVWVYRVTNDGNVDLANVAVTDNQLDAAAISCEGGSNVIALLSVDAVVECRADGVAQLGPYQNQGGASGTPVGPDGTPLTNPDGSPLPPAVDDDPSNYFGGPTVAMRVEKSTNGADADAAPGPALSVGQAVTWRYEIFNDGNVPLINVTLTDDREGDITCPTTTIPVGDSIVCTAEGVATLGDYENVATVAGTPANADGTPLLDASGQPVPPVTAEDPSHYIGVAASIGDRVWRDLNADGVQDDTEPPINGVTVTLTLDDGSPAVFADGSEVPVQVTAGDGNYLFNDLPPATYVVTVTAPADLGQTYDLDGLDTPNASTEVLGQDEVSLDHDFGYIPPGLLDVNKTTNGSDGLTIRTGSAIVWEYRVENVGEVVVTDVTVTDNMLDDDAIDCGAGSNVIASLAPGEVVVCEAEGVAIDGPYNNVATVTGTDPQDNSTDPVEDPSDYIGSSIPLGNIGDFVWDDLDNDKVQDDGEPGIPDVTIVLTLPDGTTDSTVTDADGLYLFSGLPAGDYTVTVDTSTLPADLTQTYDASGELDHSSDVTLVEDPPETIGNRLDQDFGYIPKGSLAIDKTTSDGTGTPGDGGTFTAGGEIVWTYTVTNTGRVTMSNIVVTDNMVDDGAITCEGSGSNTVAELAAGETVVCTAPGIAIIGSYENTGTVSGEDPAGIPTEADDPSNYEGVEVRPALTIGDYVWIDANENGIQDDGEAPVANATLNLWSLTADGTPDEIKETKETNDDGLYNFVIQFDTAYALQIELPSGARLTDLDAGNDDLVDSDFDPATGITVEEIKFDLPPANGEPEPVGVEDLSFDAGLVPLKPSVKIEKTTNAIDADTGTGPEVTVGDLVVWTYTVTNDGGTILANIEVTDNLVPAGNIQCSGSSNNVIPRLNPGEVLTCAATGTATEGQYNNVGNASGTPVDDNGDPLIGPDGEPLENPTSDDPSGYLGRPAPTPAPTATPIPTVAPTPTRVVVIVTATPTPTPTPAPKKKAPPLAHTGSSSAVLTLTASGLMMAGGLLVLIGRRRKEEEAV